MADSVCELSYIILSCRYDEVKIVSDPECRLSDILITDGSSKNKCRRLTGKRETEGWRQKERMRAKEKERATCGI